MSDENTQQVTNGEHVEPLGARKRNIYVVATFLLVAGLSLVVVGCLVADYGELTISGESQRKYDLRSAFVPLFITGTCLLLIGSIIHAATGRLKARLRRISRLSWLLALLALVFLIIANVVPRHDTKLLVPFDRPQFKLQMAEYGWPYTIRVIQSGLVPTERAGNYFIMKPIREEGLVAQQRLKWLLNIVHWAVIIGGVLTIVEMLRSRKQRTAIQSE